MRNLYNDIQKLPEGTYLITPDSIVDYAERWSYGYIVALREMDLADLKTGTIFGVWTKPGEPEEKVYDVVRHVDAYQDAVKLAQDMDQLAIYSLRDEKVVWL